MNELTAKNLTLEELAQRLRDHSDPIVRMFAERVIADVDRLAEAESIE